MEIESVMDTYSVLNRINIYIYYPFEESWLLPGSFYVTSPYILLDLESLGSESLQIYTEMNKSCIFYFGLGITSMAKNNTVVVHPTESLLVYLGRKCVQWS